MHEDSFAAVVRAHLPNLPSDATLESEALLRTLGLDSIGAVALLMDLQEHCRVELPTALLVPETFRSLSSLRGAFDETIAARV